MAARHPDDLPRDPSRLRGRQEHDRISDVLRCSKKAEGNRRQNLALQFLADPPCLNRSRCNRVHRDPKRAQFDGHAARQRLQGRLAGTVPDLRGEGLRRIGADVDDSPVPAAAAPVTSGELPHHHGGCLGVYREVAVERRRCHLKYVVWQFAVGGVVDEHVDVARHIEQARNDVRVHQVTGHEVHPDTGRCDLPGERLRRRATRHRVPDMRRDDRTVQEVQNHPSPLRAKGPHHRGADP